MRIVILDPVGDSDLPNRRLAPRVADLRGTTAGFLFNGHHYGEAVFDATKEKLSAECGFSAVVSRVKPNLGAPSTSEAIADLASKCDFVVLGVGA